MFSTLLYAALLLQAMEQQSQTQQLQPIQKPPVELVVFVSAPVYQPDGGTASETVALPTSGAGLVHLFSRRSVCEPAATTAAEPTDAAFGWRIASQIVSRTEKDVVVSLTWRRLWDEGRKTPNGPGSTVQLTLHQGDRIPLDHIPNAKPRPECRAVGLGLEVRLAQSPAASSTRARLFPLGSTPGGAKVLDAELWLLHTSPSDVQQVVHQTVRVPTEGGRFAFAPTAVNSARGTASVEVSGVIDRYRTPNGEEWLQLSFTRRVRAEGLPADGVPQGTGAPVPLPAPTDVLAFELTGAAGRGRAGEMPAGAAGGRGTAGAGAVTSGATTGGQRGSARGGGGGGGRGGGGAITPQQAQQAAALLEGHQFALRLRVTQVN